jgi:hypothetical protein
VVDCGVLSRLTCLLHLSQSSRLPHRRHPFRVPQHRRGYHGWVGRDIHLCRLILTLLSCPNVFYAPFKGKALPPPSTPHSPAAACDGKEHRSTWEWLATFESGGIISRWRCSFCGNFYCALCHSKDKHLPTKCPMLTEFGLKLLEVGGGSMGGSKAGADTTPAGGTAGTLGAKAAAVESPGHPTDGFSGAAPAGMTAAVVADGDEDSTDSFHWDGDEDGVTFEAATKPNTFVSSYPPSSPSPSCWRVSLEAFSLDPACSITQSVDNIVLPPALVQSLLKAIPTDEDGVTFEAATKPNTFVSSYPPSSPSPSCWWVSLEAFSLYPACSVTQSVDNIVLPPALVQSLLKAIPTPSGGTSFHLVVADTGATD